MRRPTGQRVLRMGELEKSVEYLGYGLKTFFRKPPIVTSFCRFAEQEGRILSEDYFDTKMKMNEMRVSALLYIYAISGCQNEKIKLPRLQLLHRRSSIPTFLR